jgi:hypothetical protein
MGLVIKSQPGHAEFISAPHRKGYPLYRHFVTKHVFYLASEMPVFIGMTANTYGVVTNKTQAQASGCDVI